MPTITVDITETEMSALEHIAHTPQDWFDNLVQNRARIAIDDIVKLYTERALDEGVQIPATRELIVADAFTRGWIKTAADAQAELDAANPPS